MKTTQVLLIGVQIVAFFPCDTWTTQWDTVIPCSLILSHSHFQNSNFKNPNSILHIFIRHSHFFSIAITHTHRLSFSCVFIRSHPLTFQTLLSVFSLIHTLHSALLHSDGLILLISRRWELTWTWSKTLGKI